MTQKITKEQAYDIACQMIKEYLTADHGQKPGTGMDGTATGSPTRRSY